MSVSTLESLPNELLIEIFNKYINGVDIIVAFFNKQNQRFNEIIKECKPYRFNFLHCRKDSFQQCMNHLPTYIENIEELILSEENTPGQINIFLSIFPSFINFKQLRKLYFYFNVDFIEKDIILNAIQSLINTPIQTLIIKEMALSDQQTFGYLNASMFQLPSVTRLVLISNLQHRTNDLFPCVSPNTKYLTSFGIVFDYQQLSSIFQSARDLKYLNIRLTYDNILYPFVPLSNIQSMSVLQTLILSFQDGQLTTFSTLAEGLRAMPMLRHLNIMAHKALVDATAWEALLETSLPLLSDFILRTTTSRINNADIHNILNSFETPLLDREKEFLFRHHTASTIKDPEIRSISDIKG